MSGFVCYSQNASRSSIFPPLDPPQSTGRTSSVLCDVQQQVSYASTQSTQAPFTRQLFNASASASAHAPSLPHPSAHSPPSPPFPTPLIHGYPPTNPGHRKGDHRSESCEDEVKPQATCNRGRDERGKAPPKFPSDSAGTTRKHLNRIGIHRKLEEETELLLECGAEGSSTNMINRRDGQPVQRMSEQIDLSSLKNSAMLAQRFPYICTVAGLVLQVLTTQNYVSQHKERWGATNDKLATLVSNVGRACENDKLEEDDLPHNLVTIFQVLVTELGQIERAIRKRGSLKTFFLGMYLRWKVKKYYRKVFNVLQAFHATLAFNQRFSHCAERIEVEVTDVNTRYDEDQTPLHVASQLGQLEIMHSLIDRGANVNSENANKETPLFMASRNGNIEITQLLLKNRANANHPDLENRTPLHEASENGRDSVVQELLRSEANCNAKNKYEWTPLHLASRTGNTAVVQILLDRGAEVNVQNVSKWTPLHMASQKGHVEVVKLLLARNARVDDRKADGETALHLAAYYGHVEVVGSLIRHNADPHIRNNKDKKGSDLAREKGHENVVQLIEAGTSGD